MTFRNLRTKIIFGYCLLMLLGGSFTTILVRGYLSHSLTESVDRNGIALSRTLALQLTEPLAYQDLLSVRQVLLNVKKANADIVYVFVVSPESSVVGHSFPTNAFPSDLSRIIFEKEPTTLQAETGRIRDLPAAVLNGALGTLHVGVSLASAESTTMAVVGKVLWTTAFAMGAGIIGIFFLANVITRPMHRLVEATHRIGQGDYTSVTPISGHDELAQLAGAFNQMAAHVKERMTESEDLRKYLEQVLDLMSSAVVVISGNHTIEYANHTVRRKYGEIVGKNCHDVLTGERPCHECPLDEIRQHNRVVSKTFRSETGRILNMNFVPFVGHHGQFSIVETALDTTELSVLSARLQRAERLAVAGEVAAGVVHSINNPLDGVRRALELALHSPNDLERTKRMLSLASEGTDRIASVTRSMLNLARVDTLVSPVAVSVNPLVAEAVQLVNFSAQGNSVNIRMDLDESIPAITADPSGLHEVIVNLLLNAVDASSPGGEILITTKHDGGHVVSIMVSDSGTGIPPQLLEQIFEPFFTTKEVGKGTGLGLSVARRIIEAHGGEITAVSSPGNGAVFTITLSSAPSQSHEGTHA